MSKITVSINVDSAEELIGTIQSLATAMPSSPVSEKVVKADAPVKESVKESEKQKEEPKKFTKASYFYHPESDSYLAFKKGDLVPNTADFAHCTSITKKEYEEGIAAQQEKETKKEEKTSTENIPSVVELRAKAQEKATSVEAKKAIKALLDEFGSKSISNVPEDKRAEFMARLEEL